MAKRWLFILSLLGSLLAMSGCQTAQDVQIVVLATATPEPTPITIAVSALSEAALPAPLPLPEEFTTLAPSEEERLMDAPMEQPATAPAQEAADTPLPTDTPKITNKPDATSTSKATATPKVTATPTPKVTATPKATATPKVTAVPTDTPQPTAVPTASPTPEVIITPAPTDTPAPPNDGELSVPSDVTVSGSYGEADIALAARVAYFEAGKTEEGYRAVLCVILNRVESSRWPNTVEKVCYQANQFTVVDNNGFLTKTIPSSVYTYANDVFNNGNRLLPGEVQSFRAAKSDKTWGDRTYFGTYGGNDFYS